MADTDPWLAVASSAVSAFAALGGVLLTQRATRQRDLDARLWDKRATCYVSGTRWLLELRSRIVDEEGEVVEPKQATQAVEDARMSPQLYAELTAYASEQLRYRYEVCADLLSEVRRAGCPPKVAHKRLQVLSRHIESALDRTRVELHGSDPLEPSTSERIRFLPMMVGITVRSLLPGATRRMRRRLERDLAEDEGPPIRISE
jgi:hypothetical protein